MACAAHGIRQLFRLRRRHGCNRTCNCHAALSTEPERTKTTEQHETKGRNGMFEDVSRRTFLKGTAATAALAAEAYLRTKNSQ